MKLTNHEEYGLRCLLRLAEQGTGTTMTIPELSAAEGLSEPYVGKLLAILRRGGYVKAGRGKIGGYVLARPASQIVVGEVMTVLGGPFFEEKFCDSHTGQLTTCARSLDCSLRLLWRDVQAAIDGILGRTTLDKLLCAPNSRMISEPQPVLRPQV
jgi:Rrf2 family protein